MFKRDPIEVSRSLRSNPDATPNRWIVSLRWQDGDNMPQRG